MTDLAYIPSAEMQRLRSNPEALATACRINCLSMIAEAGSGHIGACFSSMDILLWLALNEPEAVVILSRGHDLPAYLATLHAVGKLSDDALHQLRKPGGIPGHPMPGCAPGVDYSSGSLGMGLSKAKGMILADRLLGVQRRYFVLVGDGELQEGQIAEAHQWLSRSAFPELFVIIDRNQYATAAIEHGVNTLWSGWCGCFADGHDFGSLSEAVRFRKGIPAAQWPFHIIAETTKGRGVSFIEADPARWHSGAPTEDEYIRAAGELGVKAAHILGHALDAVRIPHTWPAPKPPDPLIAAYSAALCEVAAENDRIVVLDADLTKDCGLLAFKERFPDRFIECGIAEQNMVSTASGLAIRGFTPICHSFAAFLTRRALDQIYNQACEGTKAIYVGSMAGPLPETGPGKSHESLCDLTLMESVGCVTYQPYDPESVRWALSRAVETPGASYIRLCKQVSQ